MPSPEPSAETSTETGPSLARRLLDAQVAFHLARLDDDRLQATVTDLTSQVLDGAGGIPIVDLVDPAAIRTIVARALTTVPGSAAVGGIVELAVAVATDGSVAAVPPGELVERRQVETLVDELLALHPALERGLDHLTASPLVGVMASQFMGRIVGEVVQANQAVADRVPGLGSLVSFGASAASRMVGAADKQLEGLLGDTVGRGGTYAVRRLNKIVLETVRDPTTRDALLQVWDLAAEPRPRPTRGRGRDGVRPEELAGLAHAVRDVTVTALAHDQVVEVSGVVVDAFFERFGGCTATELLDELDLDRDDLLADVVAIAPGVVAALRESGELERLLRDQLAPFWESAQVRDLLGGAPSTPNV